MAVSAVNISQIVSTTVVAANASTASAGTAAHVTSLLPTPTSVSTATPQTYFDSIFESFKLFGAAVGEQSASSEAQNLRWDRFGSLAAYAFSAYGISTFFVALILNRTAVIASSAGAHARSARSRGSLAFFRNMPISQGLILALLRLSSVVLLLAQASRVLVALNVIGQNYYSENVSRLTRWIPSKYFQYDVVTYASDVYMRMPRDEVRFGPTTAMLWPVFLSVSYSLFVETFSAAISNQKPFLEGGLTLFELSLAIQEVSSGFFFLRSHNLAKRPTEQVLLVCLFSLADQVCNQIGAVLYKNKYRLVPSTVLSSMFVWYFFTLLRNGSVFSLPSEIALTYTALVLTLAVTAACAFVLLLTVVTKGARVDELNFANFFAEDHPNHEIFTRYLGLDLSQDFYTAAINLGMVAVTQAGKSSYFMAYNYVPSPRDTWVERNLWDSLRGKLGAAEKSQALSDDEQSHKILKFLQENQISGYNNIVTKPSKRLINGSDADTDYTHRVGSLHLRLTFFIETFQRLAQLSVWAFLQVFYYWPRNKFSKKSQNDVSEAGEETDEEFQVRKDQAPSFIRHLLARNDTSGQPLGSENVVSVNPSPELISEDDDSPDFEVLEYEGDASDWETEDESAELDLMGVYPGGSESSQNSELSSLSVMAELMTADTLIELFEDREILQHHLQHDSANNGILTRSRYEALSLKKSTKEQTAELLDLILAKRRTQMKNDARHDAPKDDDLGDDLDPRVACVICQVEPRTLITWPCKCLAICEGCRVSLVTKGMKGCVCCRQDVEGVSRIYLP